MAITQERKVDPGHSSTVVPLQLNGHKLPLFVIHGVDGSTQKLECLARNLDLNRPIYGIRAQALSGRGPALTRVEDLASFYLRDAKEVQPDGPYHFLGYSFGGLIAFEMARRLSAQGEQVGMVGMLDNLRMAPQELLSGSAPPRASRIRSRWIALASHLKRTLSSSGLAYAKEKLFRRGLRTAYSLLDRARLSIPRFMQRAYDINWFAAVRYVPRHFPGKLTLFQAADSLQGGRASLDLWKSVAAGGVEVREIAAHHESLMIEPNVALLAAEIRACLADLP